MNSFTVHIESVEQTQTLGVALGRNANPGDVICLDGDLGAGKTTLAQAIAKGLDVADNCYVTSPSFAIMHEYPGRLAMYHMDFYRLQDYTEVEDLGFDEYFYLSGLTVIEWSQRADEILPESRLHLKIEIKNEVSRQITCTYLNGQWHERLLKIIREAGLQQ
jgi:tRNA threonylcarbamoyladenosine biosynthesis protein TsaE